MFFAKGWVTLLYTGYTLPKNWFNLENPLLPNAKLREMYALMQRARTLTKARTGTPRLEAILCSTLMHVEPGDFIATTPGDTGPALLASERTTPPATGRSRTKISSAPPELPTLQRLATVTGIAYALKSAGTSRLAVYFTDAGSSTARTQQGWQAALAYAQAATLPLLFVCADATGTQTAAKPVANPDAISWHSMSKLGKSLKLPVLSVDGTDAAALYRIMQESTLRARTGGGPAVLWCFLPRQATAATDPIRHMKRYLADRKLLPRKSK